MCIGVIMSIKSLKFPSGRTVSRCKQDAKEMMRASRQSGLKLTHSEALDIVAKNNGIDLPWAKAILQLPIHESTSSTSSFTSAREAQQHLLGHALNKLIAKGKIDLKSAEDKENSYLECKLLGHPSVITWQYVGFGEVMISVWWNFDKSRHPQHLQGGFAGKLLMSQAPQGRVTYSDSLKYVSDSKVERYSGDQPLASKSSYKNFVGVVCSTWLERKDGTYLQVDKEVGILNSYIRKADRNSLLSIPKCKPNGFELGGKFRM